MPSGIKDLAQSEAMRALSHLGPKKLKKKESKDPKAYLVSYLIRTSENHRIQARQGTVYSDDVSMRRRVFCDVRVGDYRYDHLRDGGLYDNSSKAESYALSKLPIGDGGGLQHSLWKLTECRYRESKDQWFSKQADELHYRNPHRELDAYQKLGSVKKNVSKGFHEVDRKAWSKYLCQASSIAKDIPQVTTCHVGLVVRNMTKIFVSSEGQVMEEDNAYWSLAYRLSYVDEKTGEWIPWSGMCFTTQPSELPSLQDLKKKMVGTIQFMKQLVKAPVLRSYSGPVWLNPKPSGLLFHEALGHRLEASRLLSQGEGQTFKDTIGLQVMPEFLSMRDDPTMKQFKGQSLVGHYTVDDEGVLSDNATLVDHGVMRGFLSTRTPTQKHHKSNGHARNWSWQRPISRMGVTVVDVDKGFDEKELKQKFLEEIKSRGLPFGVRVHAADAGETATQAYDFQAFLGEIKVATKIFPDGKEELIRGVNFVGTPLNAVRGIFAAGNDQVLDNSTCGAESGFVPVSTISPSVLISDLELQCDPKQPLTAHTYPPP